MQSHVLHSSTEEFVSVTTTVTSFAEQEETSTSHRGHVNGSDGENNNPDDTDDIYGDIVEPGAPAVVRSKNGKPKRKNKGGPKSRKTRAAAKKKYLIEQRDDDEESSDLQLDDDVSEMNDATDQSNGSEPPHNGTNGHSADNVVKNTDDDFDSLVCEEKIVKDDKTPMTDTVNNKDTPVVYDAMIGEDEINRELTEDFDLDLDEDRSLADLVADHKILLHVSQPVVDTEIHKSPVQAKATDIDEPEPVVGDDIQCASSDDSFTSALDPPTKEQQPSTSHSHDMTDEEFNKPFVRYLGSVSGRRPLHSSQLAPETSQFDQFDSTARLVPGESSRNIFKYFGFAQKQSYAVNDAAPSYGKRKADSPILVEEKSSKKLKADEEPKRSKFMSSVYNLFRTVPIVTPVAEDWTKDLKKSLEKDLEKYDEKDGEMSGEKDVKMDEENDLVLEAGDVSGVTVEGEDVVGMEEKPVLQNADETNKWACAVM